MPVASQPAVLSQETLRFGRLPQRTHAHRLVTLRAPQAAEQAFTDGSAPSYDFQWEAAHDLVTAGVAGFCAVDKVVTETDRLHLLSPCAGGLPSKTLLMGDITWME